ncbi:ninjurin-2-like isoform X2 [Amphibalanus amphitrite]|uniref:ninjurin-2-like isoform X2 n=1 Tax=Amphibalanus amphitrite TaxID=1232801 RepID=UPI001C92B691|nr:ninjurin-2-like isoform X2 [Amphibalanus amphitrite]
MYDGVEEMKFTRPVTPGSVRPVRHSSHSATISYTAKQRKLDANRYATKKTIAQGMLDVALLTANASQLRYVLQAGDQHEFYTLMVTLISISIALQSIQALANVALTVMDMVEKHHDLAYSLCRWRNAFNNFTMVLASCTIIVDAIWNGFGWDSSRHVPKGYEGVAGLPRGDPEAEAVAAAAAAAAAYDDILP